jgi:hypothetical protein
MIDATMPRKRGPGRPRKHGGARPGAGRPRLAGVGTQVVAATLLSTQVAKVEGWMERHDAPNFSAALREMIDLADRLDRQS